MNLSVGSAIWAQMSNVRFSHNLNMEIAGPLYRPNRQVVLVVSHLLSTSYCWFSAMPIHLQVSKNSLYVSFTVH